MKRDIWKECVENRKKQKEDLKVIDESHRLMKSEEIDNIKRGFLTP